MSFDDATLEELRVIIKTIEDRIVEFKTANIQLQNIDARVEELQGKLEKILSAFDSVRNQNFDELQLHVDRHLKHVAETTVNEVAQMAQNSKISSYNNITVAVMTASVLSFCWAMITVTTILINTTLPEVFNFFKNLF